MTPPVSQTPTLCVADDETFWPWFSSPAFETWPDRESKVVLIPLAGMADWGLGHPLDAEETVLTHLLRAAAKSVPADRKPLILPPLRFVFGADPSCAFAVDPPTAHALIAEVAASVAAAGFRKIVLVNSSPWNEELCGAAARDLRVGRGLHMFQIHLSALDLDFHPVRSRSRRKLQTLLTALYGVEPESDAGSAVDSKPSGWGQEVVAPLGSSPASLRDAQAEGAQVLAATAAHLAQLVSDIHDRRPLTAKITPV